MNASILLSPRTLLIVLLALAGPAAAQFKEPAAFDLNFPGGTIGQYCDVLRKASGNPNVLVSTDAAKVPMPPVSLTAVTLENALALLQGMNHETATSYTEVRVETVFPTTETDRTIYRILDDTHRTGAQDTTVSRVLSVSDLIETESIKAEDLLSAIEATVAQASADLGEADIKYHDATYLLIIRAHVQQVDAIEELVKQLRSAMFQRQSPARSQGSGVSAAELEQKLAKLTADLAALRADNDSLRIEKHALSQKVAELSTLLGACEAKRLALEARQKTEDE